MKRRRFVSAAIGGTALLGGLAGCLGNDATPPPRRSTVIEDLSIADETLTVTLADDPTVESRAELGNEARLGNEEQTQLGAVVPVGRAAAKGKGGGGGKGATGRGSGGWHSAPRHNGCAVYHGGDYETWRENHDDDVSRYQAAISTVGIARLGRDFLTEDALPGPGPADSWDETYDPGGQSDSISHPIDRSGWYRVGFHLQAEHHEHDFDWEAIDFAVELEADGEYEISHPWKVSPRL
jgi:hypothetical protein